VTEADEDSEQERLKRKWARVEALAGSEQRLNMVARDLVEHFEDRVQAMDGKAMIVCMSRRICVALYDAIVALRPNWHAEDDNAGRVKVVMTGSASDPVEWQPHVGNKARRDLLAKRAKDPDDPLQLVIVRDMWLTGFDAPSMHTMYIDKPMHGHGLMHAIARVNRVFRDKPAGLVVDYIGIAQRLKEALSQYSQRDQGQTGIDEAEAVALLQEKYEVVADIFHGLDYQSALMGTPQQRLAVMGEAIDWIMTRQQEAAARESTEQNKKRAHRRYQDAVLALSKAFALAAASDYAREIREEVASFQTIRAALVKSTVGTGRTAAEKDFAVSQIIDRAVGCWSSASSSATAIRRTFRPRRCRRCWHRRRRCRRSGRSRPDTQGRRAPLVVTRGSNSPGTPDCGAPPSAPFRPRSSKARIWSRVVGDWLHGGYTER